MKEEKFVKKILDAGGRVYVAGGWVRDRVLGRVPRDKDYVITGLTEEIFSKVFPRSFSIGRKFPVYRALIDGVHCDVAFARSETKSGRGHGGFDVSFSPLSTIEDDLYRRDTTINAMALDLRTGELIDPYGGEHDARNRVIKAVSEHFADDPVRALRAARQAAAFGFRIDPGALGLMKACREELKGEPGERLVKELTMALACEKPSIFFINLLGAGILDVAFPQIYALAGARDAFVHAMEVLDRTSALSGRIEVRFAALARDIGKALSSEELRPRRYGQDERGREALRIWNAAATLPKRWIKCALFVMSEHTRVWNIKKPGKIADLLERLSRHPVGVDGFKAIVVADRGKAPYLLENYARLMEAMESVKSSDAPPGLAGEDMGKWMRARRAEAVAGVLGRKAP
ncbi:MAG: hypothetical protein LBQ19_04800, partial [Synergistaceae bacterium]|nr:hypothetical protein [Synergistaceae bacterium]